MAATRGEEEEEAKVERQTREGRSETGRTQRHEVEDDVLAAFATSTHAGSRGRADREAEHAGSVGAAARWDGRQRGRRHARVRRNTWCTWTDRNGRDPTGHLVCHVVGHRDTIRDQTTHVPAHQPRLAVSKASGTIGNDERHHSAATEDQRRPRKHQRRSQGTRRSAQTKQPRNLRIRHQERKSGARKAAGRSQRRASGFPRSPAHARAQRKQHRAGGRREFIQPVHLV
mmetsp:Transcript_8055/g.49750  ORF Transcript_8055/g.49750 Transcript_8055/m.49750 type:complete len:229 (-) Transcript_8055:3732-4418(-)